MQPLDPLRTPLTGTRLVEASAGTGKTHTITTLYVRLLLEQRLGVDQILVVTYTNAATAELRARIRSRIANALECLEEPSSANDPDLAELLNRRGPAQRDTDRHHLRRALAELDDAAVFTIHGFCQRMLLDNAFESGTSFESELLTNQTLLCEEVVHDCWIRSLHDAPPLLARSLTSHRISPESLSWLLARCIDHGRLRIIPDAPRMSTGAAGPAWRDAQARAVRAWDNDPDNAFAAVRACGAMNKNSKPERWRADVEKELRAHLPGGKRLASIARRCAKAGDSGHPFLAAVAELHAAAEELETELASRRLAFLHDLLAEVRRELGERKHRARQLSFDDLLQHLHAALCGRGGSLLAGRIRQRFPVAMIDEFQDTDPIQYEIFHRVYGDSGTLLLIGDPKQAIYAFRGADVFAYLQARNAPGVEMSTLQRNFRSRPRLVHAINHLFRSARDPFLLPEIRYHDIAAAREEEGGPGVGEAPLEFLFVRRREGNQGQGGWINRGESDRFLPRQIAAEIARVLVAPTGRAFPAGAIAVLCRTNDEARRTQDALREVGVPAVLQGDASVLDTAEAEETEQLLRALSDPGDVRAVRAALVGSLIGVRAEDLHRMAEEASAETDEWVRRFHVWHQLWVDHGFMTAFRSLLEECNVTARALSATGGERRLTNVLHVAELVQRATLAERLGPGGAVEWLQRMRGDSAARAEIEADAAQIRLESDDAAVKLTTIHKSKGLQYDVVYCPFLFGDTRLRSHGARWVRFHDAAGDLTLDLGSREHEENQRRAEREALAESLRLAYVALTRARERCRVVWGGFRFVDRSALGYLLHQPTGPAGEGSLAECTAQRIKGLDDDAMWNDLARMAAGARGTIALRELDDGPGPLRERPAVDPGTLRPPPAHPMIAAPWRLSSFSRLAAATAAEPRTVEDAPDHDQSVSDVAPPAFDPASPHAFPSGARAGLLVHAVLEHTDFTRGAPDRTRILETLDRFGFERRWAAALESMIIRTLVAPLHSTSPALSLSDVSSEHRLDELEFTIPVAHGGAGAATTSIASNGGGRRSRPSALQARDLVAAFERHGGPELHSWLPHLHGLRFSSLVGYLRGYIDLVFRLEGRWFLVDYKSNRLGDRGADYHPARLGEEMSLHHYFLQYHLYVVALHRYLRQRVPEWDYERDFAGVYYLFVRGMSAEHPGRGVFFDRPPLPLVEALDRCLRGAEEDR